MCDVILLLRKAESGKRKAEMARRMPDLQSKTGGAHERKKGYKVKKEKFDHVDKVFVGFHVLYWNCRDGNTALQYQENR